MKHASPRWYPVNDAMKAYMGAIREKIQSSDKSQGLIAKEARTTQVVVSRLYRGFWAQYSKVVSEQTWHTIQSVGTLMQVSPAPEIVPVQAGMGSRRSQRSAPAQAPAQAAPATVTVRDQNGLKLVESKELLLKVMALVSDGKMHPDAARQLLGMIV